MERRFIILPALLLITDVVKSNVEFRAMSTLLNSWPLIIYTIHSSPTWSFSAESTVQRPSLLSLFYQRH